MPSAGGARALSSALQKGTGCNVVPKWLDVDVVYLCLLYWTVVSMPDTESFISSSTFYLVRYQYLVVEWIGRGMDIYIWNFYSEINSLGI